MTAGSASRRLPSSIFGWVLCVLLRTGDIWCGMQTPESARSLVLMAELNGVRASACGGFFDVEAKQRQLDERQKQIAEPNFYSDQERSSKVLRQSARLQETLNLDRQITSQLADLEALVELAREGEPVGDEFVSSLNQHD